MDPRTTEVTTPKESLTYEAIPVVSAIVVATIYVVKCIVLFSFVLATPSS